jgi:glycogen debranching enzyme
VAEIDCVARIIEEVTPEHREAVHLGWMGEELARECREYFWDADRGFFFDRYPDDDFVAVRTVAGLVPLFAGVASDVQARELVERHVLDRNGFWTPLPLASLAADDGRCDQNMWRGAVWPAMNLLLYVGLRRYGFDDTAGELRERTLDGLAAWFEQTGTLWEFYDAQAQRSPADLPRGRHIGALPDHAWTAAAFLCLLHECPDGLG